MDTENKKRSAWNWNYLSCIFMYIVSAVIFIETFNIAEPDSRYFPRILCGLTTLLSTILLIQAARGKEVDKGEGEPISFAGTKKAAGMCLILIGYVILNMLTGFYISTVIYLPIGMIYLGQRNWKVIASISIILPVGVYFVFQKLLSMQMPVGSLFK